MTPGKAILIALTVVAFVATGGIGSAQDGVEGLEGKTQKAVLKSGEYRDLTFLRKVRLGTAPYVNPSLLNEAAIIYRYDLGDMNADFWANSEVLDAFEKGEASLAYVDPETKYLMLGGKFEEMSESVIRELYGSVTPEKLSELEKEWALVYPKPKLLGKTSSDAVVSWSPGAEIEAPRTRLDRK